MAIPVHGVIWLQSKAAPAVGISHVAPWIVIASALFFPRLRKIIAFNIGMGDLKLLLYLTIFLLPSIGGSSWLIGFSVTALVVMIIRGFHLHLSLPLAPIIFAASLWSVVQTLLFAPALILNVGELPHALVDFR